MISLSASSGTALHSPKKSEKDPSYNIKSTLELARIFSIEAESNFVLCKDFLPGIDIAVSAAGEEFWGEAYPTSRDSMEMRCREVIDVVESTRKQKAVSLEVSQTVTSFGLVHWWPISVRQRAEDSLGPFNVVIHHDRNNKLIVNFIEATVERTLII